MTRREAQDYVVQRYGNDPEYRYLIEDLENHSIEHVDACMERLLQGEPLQYITNKSHFYGKEFFVNPSVLIPRPETEELVRHIYSDHKSMSNPSIIDIGTGSGVIGIMLRLLMSNSDVTVLDISLDALEVARENARRHDADVSFVQGDILDHSSIEGLRSSYDIVVSNPPYIPTREAAIMPERVLHYEPSLALFVSDDDPLVFYLAIAKYGKKILRNGGYVYCEINEFLGSQTQTIFEQEGYRNVSIIKDMQGKDRIIKASSC